MTDSENSDQDPLARLLKVIDDMRQSQDELDRLGQGVAAAHLDMALNILIETANAKKDTVQ
ncbi:MAG: hypothetical protein ACRCY3_01075 [Sphingorhabdus sp.]